MNEYDCDCIDDLLVVVNLDLIERYEERNLQGKKLGELNKEYKLVTKERDALWRKGLILSRLTMASVIAFLFLTLIDMWQTAFALAIISLLLFFWAIFNSKQDKKSFERRKELYKVLVEFQQSVGALSPFVGNSPSKYSESVIRGLFDDVAALLLRANNECLKVRLDMTVPMSDVVKSGNWKQMCQDQFEKMIKAAPKFGITFNKAEKDALFYKAKKRLERLDLNS